MADQPKRLVAVKVNAKQILSGQYVKKEGWDPNEITLADGRKISRVNIMGVVVTRADEDRFESCTLDDGSSEISVRSFDSGKITVKIGDIAMVVGRIREYGGERYIIAEIVKKLKDPKWLKLRKLEIGDKDEPKTEQESVEVKDIVDKESPMQKIYSAIKELDKGDGAGIDEVIKAASISEEKLEKLIRNGEVYEIKPGRIKLL